MGERDWQPIETAPKDGTPILVWNGRRLHVAHFDRIEDAWVSSYATVTRRLVVKPDNWQHLPSPPALRSREAQDGSSTGD